MNWKGMEGEDGKGEDGGEERERRRTACFLVLRILATALNTTLDIL